MNKEASSLLAKLVTEIYKNEQLQQKIKHLEEKEELHLNRIDELTDRVVELETNIDEAIKELEILRNRLLYEEDFCMEEVHIDKAKEILERGKE